MNVKTFVIFISYNLQDVSNQLAGFYTVEMCQPNLMTQKNLEK